MTSRPWVIFDGDDTLWHTTVLYDEAKARLRAMLDARGLTSDEVDAAMAWLEERDVELAKGMGYSMHRFPQSLRDTASRYLGVGEHSWAALGYGYGVFASAANPKPDARGVLEGLSRDWNIALLTAGEQTVQEKRIADFEHRGLLAKSRIVPSKSADVLRSFAFEIGADPATGWVVGDSLRSDVRPAADAGFKAIHLTVKNWATYEVQGHDLPDGAYAAASLTEAADIIRGA